MNTVVTQDQLPDLIAASTPVVQVFCPHPERNLPQAVITTIYRAPAVAAPHTYLLGPGNDEIVYDDSRPVTNVSRVHLRKVAPQIGYPGRWQIECRLCGRGPRYTAARPRIVQLNPANLARLGAGLEARGITAISLPDLQRARTR